jgi:very-short-patch-repair endonuclease
MKGDFLVIPYRKDLKPISRTLRTHMTDSEQALWARLRRKQLRGIQFYRQKPIGGAIVDFFAPKAGLVIEIDGSQHLTPENIQRDKKRGAALESQGLRVLRFTNLQVLQELEGVLEAIFQALPDPETKIPPGPPLSKGG